MISDRVQISTVALAAATLYSGGQPSDLVSLSDLKLELQLTETADDSWLAKQITRASASIMQFVNRPLVQQTYQDLVYFQKDPWPRAVQAHPSLLQFSQWPMASIKCSAGIAPPLSPVLAAVFGGSLAAQSYWVRISYVTASGETPASAEITAQYAARSLLQVASPGADAAGLAKGWNVYVGLSTMTGILQNTSPIAIGTPWTMPATGLLNSGAAAPPFVLIVENPKSTVPTPLAEGVDFVVDLARGQIARLDTNTVYARNWPDVPLLVQYVAGFNPVPDDIQDACIRLVKSRWFARQRDPMIRQENIAGVSETAYWFGAGPDNKASNIPPDVEGILSNYRQPVVS